MIETMLAVLLMALLAGAVAMSFSQPLQAARAADAAELVRSFDRLGRQAAVASGKNVRLVFDIPAGMLIERDGADLADLRSRVALPQGCSIGEVRIDGHRVSTGAAIVDVSPHGWSKTFAVHLQFSRSDCWMVIAGLTGQITEVKDESQIPAYPALQRHDAD